MQHRPERFGELAVGDGVRRGEFRPDVDPRLATLALLGMLNAVSTWYGKENASLERISGEYVRLAISALASPKSLDR